MDAEEQTKEKNGQDENTGPAYDIETYRHALAEAQRTLDQQLAAFNDVNEKAWRIVQLNGLIATVYVSAVANALDDLTFAPISALPVILGLLFMGVSVFLAAEGQEAEKVTIGQSVSAFESLRNTDPSEIAYLYKTLKDYENWIHDVHQKTETNGATVNTAKQMSIIGVVFITGGTVLAIVL